jgi:pimeloyl-ACP methyl ester carboxylesterase
MKKTILIILSIVIGILVVLTVTTKVVYDQAFPRFEKFDSSINAYLQYEDLKEDYPRTEFSFPSEENNLQAYLYLQENSHGLIVISHGLGGGADSYLPYMKWFYDNGWSIFMYDNTGCIESEGDSSIGFPQSLKDLNYALDYVETLDEVKDLEVVLFGHSWGGYAVANVLNFDHEVSGVITIAGPSHADEFIKSQVRMQMGLFSFLINPFVAIYQNTLFEDYKDYNAVDAINNSTARVMIIQGKNDDLVTYDKTSIYAKKDLITRDDVIYVLMEEENRDGHDHLFRSDAAIEYIAEINIDYKALYDLYNQDIPYNIKQEFYSEIDRFKVQELNEELMQMMHDFYLDSIDN